MAKARVRKKAARHVELVLPDQDAAWENADRALQHAHILIHHQMLDPRAIEQRFNGRDQYGVSGANELVHDQPCRGAGANRPCSKDAAMRDMCVGLPSMAGAGAGTRARVNLYTRIACGFMMRP